MLEIKDEYVTIGTQLTGYSIPTLFKEFKNAGSNYIMGMYS